MPRQNPNSAASRTLAYLAERKGQPIHLNEIRDNVLVPMGSKTSPAAVITASKHRTSENNPWRHVHQVDPGLWTFDPDRTAAKERQADLLARQEKDRDAAYRALKADMDTGLIWKKIHGQDDMVILLGPDGQTYLAKPLTSAAL